MHLREVHMENFKSFGRKLTVPFEPGFTGITGPNGSGKSNIGDAVLFVLGPNSPRAIRAGKLSDLIFNGGEKGSARDHCTVSLVFDNVDRTMPVDADTVTLTRKLKRAPTADSPDGVNSYFYVNGRASQKKEFTDLLNHARISADGYNITQQGDVTQLCNMTAVKRREILDTIAGVTAFDKDIATADARKADVQANLERIAIVLEEIGRALAQLEREKESAAKYRDLQTQIGRLKGLLAWRRLEGAKAQIAQLQAQIAKFDADRVRDQAEVTRLTDVYKETQARFAEAEAKIRAEGGAEVQELQGKADKARDAMVRLEEQLNFARLNGQGAREELAPLTAELKRVDGELQRTRKAQAEQATAAARIKKELDARRADLDTARAVIAKNDTGALQLTRELAALKQEYESKSLALHEARLEADRHTQLAQALERNLAEATQALTLATTDVGEDQDALKALREQAKGQGGKQKEATRRLFDLQKAQGELGKQREELETRARRVERELAELRIAQEAADRASGGAGGQAVQMVLEARKRGHVKGVIGTVAEMGTVEDRYKTALQVAAAGRLNAILVEDDGAAAQCIEVLKKNHAGRATFLPLTKMVPGKPRGQALMKQNAEGSLGFAIDLIQFNPRYQNAFFQVFGDTLVFDTMASARRAMGGVRIVTLDGELFEASGAITGGSMGRKKGEDEVSFGSGDRARMDELMVEAANADRILEELTTRLASIRTEIESLQAQMAAEGLTGASLDDRVRDLERRLEAGRERVAGCKVEVARLEGEARDAAKAKAAAEATIATLAERLEGMERERQAKGTLMLKDTPKAMREKVEALETGVRELTEQLLRAENAVSVAATQLAIVETRRGELEAAVAQKAKAEAGFAEDEKRYKAGHQKAQAELEAVMKMQGKAAGALKGLSERKDKLYKELVDLQAKLDKVRHQAETNYGLGVNARSKLPAVEELLGEAMAELQANPVDVKPGEEVPPQDELKRELRNREASLANLGPVNMTALEQYDEQARRQGELKAEVERLEAQKGDLIRLVGEIQLKKKGALMEVFTAINESFSKVYSDISLGGKAFLQLENPDDPFAGGLIIKAQPPGKKVLRIDALSGGEKSLTSMAFIFAIQRYDPSPFYYFDEVDQNLDAVNSELLAKMIRDNSRFAQFIVVSLRKITLKEANHLYGVTQQRPGESEIIANFDIDTLRDTDKAQAVDGATGGADGEGEGGPGRKRGKNSGGSGRPSDGPAGGAGSDGAGDGAGDGEDGASGGSGRVTMATKTRKKTVERTLKDTIGGMMAVKPEA